MSKEKLLSAQTKAELIKTIGVLRRHEARLLRDIDRLNAKVDKLERASVEMEPVTTHGTRTGRLPLPTGQPTARTVAAIKADAIARPHGEHVTPLPANAYGPFPWEPKR